MSPLSHLSQTLLFGLACMLNAGAQAAEEAGAGAGTLSNEPLAMANLVQLTLGMLAVLLLLAGMAWLLRRSGRFTSGAQGALRVVGGISMGTRERVVLLQVGKQQILLGVAPGRIQTLHVLDEPVVDGEAPTSVQGGFTQVLESALSKGKSQ